MGLASFTLHKRRTGIPGLADLLANGIVAVAVFLQIRDICSGAMKTASGDAQKARKKA